MSMVTIQIACDSPFFASIGDIVLDGRSDAQAIDLAAGRHQLVWAVVGGTGGAFKATIKDGARIVCSIADWKIPVGGGWSGDLAAFSI